MLNSLAGISFLLSIGFYAKVKQITALSLIICLFSLSCPAAPQMILNSASEWQRSAAIGLKTQGWDLAFFLGYVKNFYSPEDISQETQEQRDARVVRFETNVPQRMVLGMESHLSAIPYDTNDISVSRVGVTWTVVAPNRERYEISNGIFKPEIPGDYTLTADGAGQQIVSEVHAIDPNDTKTSEELFNKNNVVTLPENTNLVPIDGWDAGNIGHAHEPGNALGDTPGVPKKNDNFNIVVPILSMPGRAGHDLELNMFYNSRVWSKLGQDITFDIDKNEVAPGWTIGFGKIINLVDGGIFQINSDGSKRFFAGSVTTTSNSKIFEGESTDGSFIKARNVTSGGVYPNGICYWGGTTLLKYPDGTTVYYETHDAGTCHAPGVTMTQIPIFIADKHGNRIGINYYNHNPLQPPEPGKWIDLIGDSLGRIYRFNYTSSPVNGRYLITGITASGPGGASQRTVVRFNYKDHQVSSNFINLTPHTPDGNINVLSAVYYPASSTGYWFGDTDSYSPYGMIRKLEEQKGMTFNSSNGVISAGQMSRRRTYSYPENTSNPIADVPSYQTVSEIWDGMPNPSSPAVTTYQIDWASNPRTTTIINPYGTGKTTEYSYNLSSLGNNDPEKAKDGVTFKTEFRDGSDVLRTKDEISWELGHNVGSTQNPVNVLRPTQVAHTEYENGITLTKKTIYDHYGDYNRVEEMHETGYGGDSDILRRVKTQYVHLYDTFSSETDWNNSRIINVPTIVEIFDSNNIRIDYTKYEYDQNTVSTNLGYNPPGYYCDPLYCGLQTAKGNVSHVIKYENAGDLSGQVISDNRVYDKTGNMISYERGNDHVQSTSLKFTSDTAGAFPSEIEQGDITNPSSPNRTKTTGTYDINLGVPLSVTDPNLKTVQFTYDVSSWRLSTTLLPTGGYSSNSFDDANGIYTQTSYTSGGAIAGRHITKVNGLRLPYRQETLIQSGGVSDVVENEYDNQGRLTRTSNPFRSNVSAHGLYWSEIFYDWAGRIEKTKNPNGAESFNYFNESARPQGASSSSGNTLRTKDPLGRENWRRTDADGNVVEVVEPNPGGNGSVSTGGLLTKFYYNQLKNLVRIEQGSQERRFKYDSLGRVVSQKMAETSGTLDDSGQFVGTATGQWSDHFTYDNLSNVTSAIDARGAKTVYSRINPSTGQPDLLNRLFAINYEVNGAADVLPAPTVKITYPSSGNASLASSIYTEKIVGGSPERVVTFDLGYDSFGRPVEKKTTFANRSNYPVTLNYAYDSLNRLTDIFYPSQYGISGNPRKDVHNDYDIAGRISGLKVDSTDYASNIVYNSADQINSIKIGPAGSNQITEQYNYNPQTALLENQKVLQGSISLLDLTYEYQTCSCSGGSGNGQVTKVVNNLDRNKDRIYEYDKLARLKKVTGGINLSWSQSYSYDRYGNRYNVTSAGFEALRAAEQARYNKNEQEKLLKDSIPSASLITKESLLEKVRESAGNKLERDSESPLDFYKHSAQAAEISTTDQDSGSAAADKENLLKDPPSNSSGVNRQYSELTTTGTPFDFDGDGKADYSAWRRKTGSLTAGTWLINNSQTGQNSTASLGASGKQIAPGDYDGDGKTDKAIWDPATGDWTIQYSSNNSISTVHWGIQGDVTVPADYDGDHKTDIAIWRPTNGYWYIVRSSDSSWYVVQFGGGQQFGDIPIVGDYDGDGHADITVWRPTGGIWYVYILTSSSSQILYFQWGMAGDVPVAADYDGDNITDLAVWRPSSGVWYIYQTSNGQFLFYTLGSESAGDVLVPADYDGDHKTDLAIWTPSTGTWTIRQSPTGNLATHQLGMKDDVAVPSAYVRRSSAPKGQSTEIPRDGYENLTFNAVSNRITTSGFEYDFAGNQTRVVLADSSILRFQYDAAGRLAKVKDDNQQTLATYTYGMDRQRLVRQEGSESSTNITYYSWEGETVVGEFAESTGSTLIWSKNYIYTGSKLLATQDKAGSGETVNFDHPDRLGTRIISNPATGGSSEQSTLPFGTALDSESTGSSNIRFTSYDRSGSTGLDYAVNRFYDSKQGRFTQVDPKNMGAAKLLDPQTLNLYSYTANDPVNRTDANGLDWFNYSVTWGGWGTLPVGASSNGFWSALGHFLTGFLGSLFGTGHPTLYYIWTPLNSGSITPYSPPSLPGAGLTHEVSFPPGQTKDYATLLHMCAAAVSSFLQEYARLDNSGNVDVFDDVRSILDFAAGNYNAAQTGFAIANAIQETQWFLKVTEPISNLCVNYRGGCDYRGRGYTHLTRDDNYAAISNYLHLDNLFVTNPELVATPQYATLSMDAFFKLHGVLDGLANSTDYLSARKKINPNESLTKKIPGAKHSKNLGDRIEQISKGVASILPDCGISW